MPINYEKKNRPQIMSATVTLGAVFPGATRQKEATSACGDHQRGESQNVQLYMEHHLF